MGGIPLPGYRTKIEPSPPPVPLPVKVRKLSVVNLEMPSANTEYSWQMPIGLKRFTLHTRDGTAIRISTFMDKVANLNPPYWTLKRDTVWSEDNLDIQDTSSFLYFACGSASKVVEIIVEVE